MKERSKLIVPFLLFLAVFFVYVRTLNPVFHSDDSPETIACAYTLGIQHPPGYPLPTLTGKIFSMLPIGNIGYRVNLQSALFGALLSVVIYFIILNLLRTKEGVLVETITSAFAATLSSAFSFTIWNQSLSAKGGIYILNGLLLGLIILSLFYWEKSKKYKFLYMAVFLFGISLGNHWESMAVAFPALMTFVVLVFIRDNFYKTITPVKFLTAFGLGVISIFIYAYLLIRANGGAFLNWGDPVNLKQLFWVLTRAEYSATEKASDLLIIAKQISRVFKLVLSEFTLTGILIFTVGIFGLLKRKKNHRLIMFGVLLVSVIGALTFYFNLKDEMIWIMDVFMIPVYMSMAILIGVGINTILQLSKKFTVAAVVIIIQLPIYLLISNWHHADQSGYYYGYDYGLNMIKSMDKPGVAMLEGDYAVMPQMYFKYIEKRGNFCPVTTIFLYVPWSIKNLKNECPNLNITINENASLPDKIRNVVESNYTTKEIYASVFRKALAEYYPQGNAVFVPYGAVMKLSLDKAKTLSQAESKLKMITYRGLLGGGAYMDTTTRLGMSNYSSIYMETGNAFANINQDEKALGYLNKAVALSNDQTRAISLTHLGVLYSKMGKYDKSMECYKETIAINPESIEALSNMAGIYNNKKEYDKAIEVCEKALKINAKFSEAYNNMAIAYYNKGDGKKAILMMEKAVELNPTNELAKKNLMILKGVVK